MGHVGGAGVRILVDDSLKLVSVAVLSALFGGSEAGEVRLRGGSSGAQLRVHGANGLREFEAGFFVLRALR